VIVGFEQDPNAPFGSGNFRDESGRITYLHDPDTASDFVPTMPGARNGGGGGSLEDQQRSAVAKLAGADAPPVEDPAKTPEVQAQVRSIEDRLGQPSAVQGDSLDPAVQDATSSGPPSPAQAVADLDATKAKTDGAPASPAAAGTPQAEAHAAVSLLDEHKAKVDPRTVAPTPATLAERDTLGLPPASVSDGETITEVEGRPIENVAADDAAIQSAIDTGDRLALEQARAADRAADTGYRAAQAGQQRIVGRNEARVREKQRAYAEAEAEQKRLNEALKENDEKLDPDRYMRHMPGAKRASMVFLAALNGGFGAIIGDHHNDVLEMVQKGIDQDIDKQKAEIASGRVRIGNEIAKWMQRGAKAEEAEALARDHAEGALDQILDLEVKRIGAQGANERALRMAIAPKLEERATRRAALLAQAETKKSRALEAKTTHAVPQLVPGVLATPQNQLAQENLDDRKIQRENAAHVGEVVGHPVSVDEAKEIKDDAQDLGKRMAVAATTKSAIRQLATKLGLQRGAKGWEGEADPGSRPLGLSVTDRAKQIDQLYALVKRADIMGMTREPSAKLQDEFGKVVDRPFFDSQIATQLNGVESVISMAEAETRRGFSDEANAYYDRRNSGQKKPAGGGGASAAKPIAAPAPGETLGSSPLPKTLDGRPGNAERY
jgi:hypothetical protein